MRRRTGWTACTLLALPLLAVACGEREEPEPQLPAGVSVDPPPTAPATGGMVTPGTEPTPPLPAGAEEPALTDTVMPPAERPDGPAAPPLAPPPPR